MEKSRFRRRFGLCTCLVAFVLLYLASYAPYLRFCYGADPPPQDATVLCVLYEYDDAWENETSHGSYAPIEWLVDHTPAWRPIFWWADVCGAGTKSRYDAAMRCSEQEL